jgi:hypothetical protein
MDHSPRLVPGCLGEKKPPGLPAVSWGLGLRFVCLREGLSNRRAVREPKVGKEKRCEAHGHDANTVVLAKG